MVGFAGLALVLAACSASGRETSTAAPNTVSLSGWITWLGSTPEAYVPDSTSPFGSQLGHETYESSVAQPLCRARLPEVADSQIVVDGSNGDTLAAATIEDNTLTNGQAHQQQGSGGFACGVAWRTGPVKRQVAYTIKFDNQTVVVNGPDASKPINLYFRLPSGQ